MRPLSASLLTAQKEGSQKPFVEVKASNKTAGVVRLDWEQLYSGSEDDYYHAATIPADGSLVRVRVTPPADGRKLYRQRVVNPGPGSDFSPWTYTGQYNVVVTAAASLGSAVSIFWIGSNREIRRIASTDYGATWSSPELIDYSPTTAIYGIAAAYKPNGDLAMFFADQSTLYVKRNAGGYWQTKTAWDKTTGNLSGAAVVYSSDWALLVTGRDIWGDYKLWSLIYGDGGEAAAGTWSPLQDFASAPGDGNFEYAHVSMTRPDVFRCFYIEKFTGNEAYSRLFWSNSAAGAGFAENLWREPAPLDLSRSFGLAVTHYGDFGWLSAPSGVWRTPLAARTVDLTADVLASRLELNSDYGEAVIQLRNDDGRYSPGGDSLSVLTQGGELLISPGYATPAGSEISSGLTFSLETMEHVSAAGKATVLLFAADGWTAIRRWRARHQFRWNNSANDMCVKDIVAFVLARVGLKLEVISQSGPAAGFYPDFSINPGDTGTEILGRLLSFVPDVLFVEGQKAFFINPQPDDNSCYSYGTGHGIFEGAYRSGAGEFNRVRVEGQDGSGAPVLTDSFAWEEINRTGERILQVTDRNVATAAQAHLRGESILAKAGIRADAGSILVPINCGQQLWDVIDITDERAGLSVAKKRVIGISTVYEARKGEYSQRLMLGRI